MEIQFQHHHVLTFCDQNEENFSQILLKFFKRDGRNRRKVDDEEDYAESDDEEDYPKCCVCFEIVDDGPVYFCEICDGIWVHKFCASLPPEIRAHPLHLQHQHLSLTPETSYDFHYCHCCWDMIITNYYECSECGFKLDCKCALSPDNDDIQQITASLSPDTKTQISHDTHPHTLFLFNSRSRKKLPFSSNSCKLCDRELLGLTYGCFTCKFYLHKKCVEISQQECEIQHPCHSHHPVSIQYRREKFICDQCRYFSSGIFVAICKTCDFKIDFKCAFLRDATIQTSIGDEVKAQIRQFIHDLHPLSFFNYIKDFNRKCQGCGLLLSGPCYGCLECSVYLHKSCAELPQIIRHVYHPFHNLFLGNSISRVVCRSCGNDANKPSSACALCQENSRAVCTACKHVANLLNYRCHLCPFRLDTRCAINNLGVISAIKNQEYHQHDLYYYVGPPHPFCDFAYSFWHCKICGGRCKGSFYICLVCNTYFHGECIGIPKEVKHDSHIHPLTLMDPLTEDDIDESKDQYYCYTCENKRNPRYYAYSFQQCTNTGHIFTAHIECVLSTELNEIEHNPMIEEDDEEKFPDLANLSISPRCMKQLLIKDKYNDHILNYFEDRSNFRCYLCEEFGKNCSGYECSFCRIRLHKECANLPFKIKHNLHEHPLFIQGGDFLKRFICDGCQVYHRGDMCYHCEECSFSLDRMCAQGIPSTGNHYRKLNDNESKVGFSHFSHNHKLRFALIKLKVDCSACELPILGPTYCCYTCSFFLHESCFDELRPQYIQHPFHIQHPLHFKQHPFDIQHPRYCNNRKVVCRACKNHSSIGYECAEGDFQLDIKCVKYLTSSLQHKCHEHKLFCFVAKDIIPRFAIEKYSCKKCSKYCNESFYRCLECDINLHIDCIPIPKNVKSVCHVYPLTLMDTIAEEVRDEYYCDTCESLRNPKHAAYCCKKCYYTAHIGCVLDEEDGEIEIL